MNILHTENSLGWGGQEIRILVEAEGMRRLGHEIFFAVARGGQLAYKAKERGFCVLELDFGWVAAPLLLVRLLLWIRTHAIDLVNTHSSIDAWLGGVAARIAGRALVRTRHTSTPIRNGFNSRILYKGLADRVVTTSPGIIPMIVAQAGIDPARVCCVPTGVDPSLIEPREEESQQWRERLGAVKGDFLVGTVCVVRSWKGIEDLLKAAALLKELPHLKWAVVGGGYVERVRPLARELGVEHLVTFTGHLERPYEAMRAMDLFLLLSTANEGISQALLQAAYLERPLLATSVGGSPEVCLQDETGWIVPPHAPHLVAAGVRALQQQPELCRQMGLRGRQLVQEKFTLTHTLEAMLHVYAETVRSGSGH